MASNSDPTRDYKRDLAERERLLDEWVATNQQIAKLEAKASAILGERMQLLRADIKEQPRYRDAIFRSLVAEFSAAGHVSMTSAERALIDAQSLDDYFPQLRDAFHAGTISAQHVREVLCAATVVSEAVRNRRVDAETLALYETAAILVAQQRHRCARVPRRGRSPRPLVASH